jgi:hypothetical protein
MKLPLRRTLVRSPVSQLFHVLLMYTVTIKMKLVEQTMEKADKRFADERNATQRFFTGWQCPEQKLLLRF